MDYSKNIRLYSLLGQRGTFGVVLKELADEYKEIVGLSADLTRTSGLEQFANLYPERFYNVGIAEENAVGMAAGLADCGNIPFVTTFANFATLRANEFVRHFMAYMKCNIKLVGFGSGFAMEFFGNTHYGLEDIAVIRSMPNISIFSPADGLEVAKCVDYAVKHQGPFYIRLSGKMNMPIVYKKDYYFDYGKAVELSQGQDVVIYSTGSMVNVAQKVVKELSKKCIPVGLYNFHTIKPFDRCTVLRNKNIPLIITLEEHCIIGGLGSAVAEILSEEREHGELVRLGTKDVYMPAGDYEFMLETHKLTVESVMNIIQRKIETR